MVMSAILLIGASLVVTLASDKAYRAQSLEAAHGQADVLAETVTAALAFEDRKGLQDYINALRANGDVEAVGVYDEHSALVGSYKRTPDAPSPPASSKTQGPQDGIAVWRRSSRTTCRSALFTCVTAPSRWRAASPVIPAPRSS